MCMDCAYDNSCERLIYHSKTTFSVCVSAEHNAVCRGCVILLNFPLDTPATYH